MGKYIEEAKEMYEEAKKEFEEGCKENNRIKNARCEREGMDFCCISHE